MLIQAELLATGGNGNGGLRALGAVECAVVKRQHPAVTQQSMRIPVVFVAGIWGGFVMAELLPRRPRKKS